jgi:hypothetical protein
MTNPRHDPSAEPHAVTQISNGASGEVPSPTLRDVSAEARLLMVVPLAIVVLGLIFLMWMGFQRFVVVPRDEARDFEVRNLAYKAAKRSVTPEAVSAVFRKWHRTTSEGGVALHWSGATSELLWIQYVPASRNDLGRVQPDSWIAWARSPGGRYFKVECWLDVARGLYVVYGPRVTSVDDLVDTLVAGGHTAVIEKLQLPRKPA